ncbi:hypothetical protein D3C84_530810 [compost metagenome]
MGQHGKQQHEDGGQPTARSRQALVGEDQRQPGQAQQHADHTAQPQPAFAQPERGQQAGDQRRQAENHRHQPRIDARCRPIDAEHADEQPAASAQVGQ